MATGNEQDRDDGGFLSRWSRRKVQVRQGAVVAEPPAPAPTAAAPLVVRAEPAPGAHAKAAPSGARAVAPPAGVPAPEAALAADPAPALTAPPTTLPPPPTLADVAALTAESDYARFVAPGVDRGVKNAALKKLFTNPHFNIMDGLDTYIDDYGKPDPLPAGMLRQMAQSHALGLFADDPPAPLPDLAMPLAGTPATAPDRASNTAPNTAQDTAQDAAQDAALDPAPPAALPPTSLQPKTTPDEDIALRLQPHDAAGSAGPGPGAEPDTRRQP